MLMRQPLKERLKMKNKLTIQVTKIYEIEVNEKAKLVKDYKDTQDLVNDLADNDFEYLPVIDSGVEIMNDTVIDAEVIAINGKQQQNKIIFKGYNQQIKKTKKNGNI